MEKTIKFPEGCILSGIFKKELKDFEIILTPCNNLRKYYSVLIELAGFIIAAW
jgi:hypothetical protein